jgi:hypothetical protein
MSTLKRYRESTGSLVRSSEVFVEAGAKGFSLQPIDDSPAAQKKCEKLDQIGCGPQCSAIADRRLSFDGRYAELGRGSSLLRLSVTPEGELALIDGISMTGLIRGIRSTAESAYLITGDGKGKPTRVALGASMTIAGSHDVGDWVFGEQSDRFRARVSCDGERQIVAAGVLILYGVPGVSLLTYGFFTRASSVDRLTTIRGPKRVSGLGLALAF